MTQSVPKMSRALYAMLTVLLVITMRLSAHHSFASEYDANRLVKVSGTVTDFEWTNPHAMLYIDGTDETGKSAQWKFEMGAPGGLIRRGWKKLELHKGDHITITGFAAKDAENAANAATVTMPDGRKLFGGFASTPGAPANK